MKTILYTFADGHKEELEVTDEVAEVFYELEKYEQKVNRKETRRHVSLDMLEEAGFEFADSETTIEALWEKQELEEAEERRADREDRKLERQQKWLESRLTARQAQADVIINYLGNKKILESVKKANKLKTFSFNVADQGDIRKSLDETLSWTRDVDSFLIKITIKNPSVKYLEQILNDNGKYNKIIKPVLSFQDEYFNDAIANIFEESFSIKESIEMKEIDLKNYGSIKNKLVNAMNKYMG